MQARRRRHGVVLSFCSLAAVLALAAFAAAGPSSPAFAAGLGPAHYTRPVPPLPPPRDTVAAPQRPLDLAGPLTLVAPRSALELDRHFRRRGLSLDAVAKSDEAVPRLYVVGLPPDLKGVRSLATRKELFLGSVLPLVLLANEEVRGQRERLLGLRARLALGETLPPRDAAWLSALAQHYRVEGTDLDALLLRVAEVPVSLALAQAVVESGWGTSRLAREDNALFGQRSRTAAGFRSFDDLMGSVRAYVHNLNSHPRYSGFRERRAEMLTAGEPLDGLGLAATLERYAESDNYAGFLRSIIRGNGLQELEGARLDEDLLAAQRRPAPVTPDG